MPHSFAVRIGWFILAGAVSLGMAQQDRLQGRWEGNVQSPLGERPASASFKREGEGYTGAITGLRGDMPFKEVRLEGEKVIAVAQVDSPQGVVVVNYQFLLQGETLKGKAEVEFGGQSYSFEYDLKRVSTDPTPPATTAQSQQQAGQQRAARVAVPQPTQKQALEYFAGSWSYKWLGRESPLGPGGPFQGTMTFTPHPDGKFLEGLIEGTSEAGPSKSSVIIAYHADKKLLVSVEPRETYTIVAVGDWSSPIAIRFDIAPIKIKGQTIRLKRIINIVAAHSFTLTEEFSIDDGPFQRLGNGAATRVMAEASKK